MSMGRSWWIARPLRLDPEACEEQEDEELEGCRDSGEDKSEDDEDEASKGRLDTFGEAFFGIETDKEAGEVVDLGLDGDNDEEVEDEEEGGLA